MRFVDHPTRELQLTATPGQVLQWLKEGNERFCSGRTLTREPNQQLSAIAGQQYPLAVVMTCMDSRTPPQVVFDMGVGELLNISQAGNALLGPRNLASVEYACLAAGAKLVVILGHLGSSVLESAVETVCGLRTAEGYGQHFSHIVEDISQSIDQNQCRTYDRMSDAQRRDYLNEVARRHVLRNVQELPQRSHTIKRLIDSGSVAIIGALVNPANGAIEFMLESAVGDLRSPPFGLST